MEKEIVCKKNFEKEILQSSSCGFKFVLLEENRTRKCFHLQNIKKKSIFELY